MNQTHLFSLQEANDLIPQLKAMLEQANEEISELGNKLEEVAEDYADAEEDLAAFKATKENEILGELKQRRHNFGKSIADFTQAKQEYLDCVNKWLEKISDMGVILRDIRAGLVDFPARHGKLDYFLCWKGDEKEITHWHPIDAGYLGRRPLVVLEEYI